MNRLEDLLWKVERLEIVLKNLEALEKENKMYRSLVKSQIESISEDLREMMFNITS